MSGLTQRQRDLLAFLHSEEVKGRTPCFREIASALGLQSKSSIARLVEGLEMRGYIRRLHNCPRSIEVVRMPATARGEIIITGEVLSQATRAAALMKQDVQSFISDAVRRACTEAVRRVGNDLAV